METTENNHRSSRCCGGRKPRAWWIVLGIIGFTAFAILFGAVVMWLWNWLMPAIFSLGVITYWQAVGLAVLGRLLFGSLHHGRHHRGHHNFGPWKHKHQMHHMHEHGNCKEHFHGSKWSHYDGYWQEEGEQAFKAYVARKGEAGATGS